MFRPIEQIAVHVPDVDDHIGKIGNNLDWVRDRVDAVHVYAPFNVLGESFQVELAFNYDLIPGKELELIQLRNGMSIQLYANTQLSHFGYHLPDPEHLQEADERMLAELQQWQDAGAGVAQVSQTLLHAGTKMRYRYAFVDTRPSLGGWLKIIQRMPTAVKWNDDMIRHMRGVFDCLRKA